VIVPGRKYTFQELELIRQQHPDAAREWSAKGYAWRFELDGTAMLVHWTQATGGGGAFGQAPERPLREFAGPAPELRSEDLPRIVKRTPQQRLASLMAKVDEDIKAGRVLRLDKAREITGDKNADVSEAETRRRITQAFIEKAEAVNEEAEAKKVTRTAPTD